MIDETLDGFSTLKTFSREKQQRFKMLTADIKSIRYRVHSIFTRLEHAQDKEDMLFILNEFAMS